MQGGCDGHRRVLEARIHLILGGMPNLEIRTAASCWYGPCRTRSYFEMASNRAGAQVDSGLSSPAGSSSLADTVNTFTSPSSM